MGIYGIGKTTRVDIDQCHLGEKWKGPSEKNSKMWRKKMNYYRKTTKRHGTINANDKKGVWGVTEKKINFSEGQYRNLPVPYIAKKAVYLEDLLW